MTGFQRGTDGRSEITEVTGLDGERVSVGSSLLPEQVLRGEDGAITLAAAVAGYARRSRRVAEQRGMRVPLTWCRLLEPLPDVRTAGIQAHAEARAVVHRSGEVLTSIRLLPRQGGQRVEVQLRVLLPRLTGTAGIQHRVWELVARPRTVWARDRVIDSEIRRQGAELAQQITRLDPVVQPKKTA